MLDISKTIQEWSKSPNESFRIIAFGSSNTEQFWRNEGRYVWVDWLNVNLRQNMGRHIVIINQGIGGDSTENLLNRIDRDVLSFSPQLAIVTIGGNDAIKNFTYEKYSQNLKKVCSQMLERNIQPIFQTYYCPCYDELGDDFRIAFESFVEANRSISVELDIPLIDQYKYFEPFHRNNKEEYKRLMVDRLHVNHYGQLLWVSLPQDILDYLTH